MKHTLTSILLLLLLSSTVYAGNGQGPGMRNAGQQQRMAHIQQSLGLSQDQVEQIREIRRNGGGRDEIRGVLTEEQRTMMDEHRAARQGRGQGPGYRQGNRGGYRAGQGNPPADSGDDQG